VECAVVERFWRADEKPTPPASEAAAMPPSFFLRSLTYVVCLQLSGHHLSAPGFPCLLTSLPKVMRAIADSPRVMRALTDIPEMVRAVTSMPK